MKISTSPSSSLTQRKMRTRVLIQLGGLMEHAETLDIFNIPLDRDLQTDPTVKNNIAALFKGLLTLNEMVTSGELDLGVLALQGLEAFKAKGLSESRPLDQKKPKLQAYPQTSLPDEMESTFATDSAHAEKLQGQSSRQGRGKCRIGEKACSRRK